MTSFLFFFYYCFLASYPLLLYESFSSLHSDAGVCSLQTNSDSVDSWQCEVDTELDTNYVNKEKSCNVINTQSSKTSPSFTKPVPLCLSVRSNCDLLTWVTAMSATANSLAAVMDDTWVINTKSPGRVVQISHIWSSISRLWIHMSFFLSTELKGPTAEFCGENSRSFCSFGVVFCTLVCYFRFLRACKSIYTPEIVK